MLHDNIIYTLSNKKEKTLLNISSETIKMNILTIANIDENIEQYCYMNDYLDKDLKNAIIKNAKFENVQEKEKFLKSFKRYKQRCLKK